MVRAPLVAKSRFIGGDDGRAWLYTAGEGLAPLAALDATRRYYENRSLAGEGRARHAEVEHACRAGLARLLGPGVTAGDVALPGSASEGVNAIFDLIDWQPGDNVVVPVNDLEFPSTVLPAVRREAQGVELRAVDHEDWVIAPERIAAAVDARTRLVFVSHVSYRTGFRFDLAGIRRALDAAGSQAILAVDATQSLGVAPVPAIACDFVVASTCKWLLGSHGIAAMYWNRARRPEVEPRGIGWYSVVDDLHFPYELKPDAGRFELGAPNIPGTYGLLAGLEVLLEIGIERLEAHAVALGTRLLERLRLRELPLITPPDPSQRAGIVAWLDQAPAATAAALANQGVIVTGSAGRIRAAMHLYNDAADVDRLVEALFTL